MPIFFGAGEGTEDLLPLRAGEACCGCAGGVAVLPGQVVEVCGGSVSWKPDVDLGFLTFSMPWAWKQKAET